jgi:acyl-CoA thioester hydrolase
VRYEIGIFASGDETMAADGHFIHVFVNRATMRPTPIPAPMREALTLLVTP